MLESPSFEMHKARKKERKSQSHRSSRSSNHNFTGQKKVDFNLKQAQARRSKSLPANLRSPSPRKKGKKNKLTRCMSLPNEIARILNRHFASHRGAKKVNPKLDSALGKSSFVAFNETSIHMHNHRKTPHMHTTECDRHISGVDKNRCARFYFTKQITPVRVYLNYNERLVMASSSSDLNDKHHSLNASLNGRKLSPKTLKSQFKLSPKFVEDAKNLIFLKDSMSFVPPVTNFVSNLGNLSKINDNSSKSSNLLGHSSSFVSVKYRPARRTRQLSSTGRQSNKPSVMDSEKSKKESLYLN